MVAPAVSLVSFAALAMALACAQPVEVSQTGEDPRPLGLTPLGQARQPTTGAHLAEIAAYGDRWVYVANSNDVFAVYDRQSPDGLEVVVPLAEGVGEVRCTILVVDEASESLYCLADEGPFVHRYSLADPAAPTRVETFSAADDRVSGRDTVLLGDHLFIASFEAGVASVALEADGSFAGTFEVQDIGGNVRMLAAAGDRLWAMTSQGRLHVFDVDGAGHLAERDTLDVDGPALDVGLDESTVGGASERAILALGSAGAAIVEWRADEGLRTTANLHPPGVVAAADLDGDAAAVVTMTGAYLYDLRDDAEARVPDRPGGGWAPDEPPIAGFQIAGAWGSSDRDGSMLYARFSAGELLVTDWNYVDRFGIDLDGYPAGVDLQRAAYHASDEDQVGIGIRNPGSQVQSIELELVGGEQVGAFDLEPFETRSVWLPAERFEVAVPEYVFVTVREGELVRSLVSTSILRRPSDAEWPIDDHGVPAPGDAFPTLVAGRYTLDGSLESVDLPSDGPQRVVFWGIDCVAMWPQIDDLLWRMRSDADPLGPEGAFLGAEKGLGEQRHLRWDLEGTPWGFFSSEELPEAIASQNPWSYVYDDGMALNELPSAAHHPTDYELDADGVVEAVEREYRGAFPLHASAID